MYLKNSVLEKQLLEGDEVGLIESLYLIANRLNIKWHVDEDAIQDAVIYAWQRRDRFDPTRGQAFAWCTQIICNCFRWGKRKQRQAPVEFSVIDSEEVSPIANLAFNPRIAQRINKPLKEDRRQNKRKVKKGTPQTQKLGGGRAKYYTHNGETLTLREWADKVGITKSTLKLRLSRYGWTLEEALTDDYAKWAKAEKYTYRGKTQTISEWADDHNLTYCCLKQRLTMGWSIEKALTTPITDPKHTITYNGETHTYREWAAITGLRYRLIWERINKRGWSIEKTLTTPGNKPREPQTISKPACAACGKELPRAVGRKKYCSDKCKRRHYREKAA